MTLGCPACGSLITDQHLAGCSQAPLPQAAKALVDLIDNWRALGGVDMHALSAACASVRLAARDCRVAAREAVATCKGDWSLGSACGKCERCRDAAIALMPALLADRARLKRMLMLVLPRPPGAPIRADLSEGLRLRCYDELRGIVKELSDG